MVYNFRKVHINSSVSCFLASYINFTAANDLQISVMIHRNSLILISRIDYATTRELLASRIHVLIMVLIGLQFVLNRFKYIRQFPSLGRAKIYQGPIRTAL